MLALTEGVDALAAVRLELLRPVQPMLASTADDVAAALVATGPASVEWKLDGARIQVHRHDDEVRVYTRNLNEVTDRLPEVVAAVRTFPARELVLDGEAIGLSDDERPHRFQDTMSRFGRQRASTRARRSPLTAFFFDVLHVDGARSPRRAARGAARCTRRRSPASARSRRCGPTMRPSRPRCSSDALAAGHEGVMVKALVSPYEAGRRGGAWRKVKPVRTLDLVVLAVEWGSGRRQGWLSNLHLGARGADGEFVMVGKTFKGLTDELLTWQTERFLELKVSESGHTVYVRPEQVVEIALDGVQASRRYSGGVALRFARVRRYRPDKTPAEADTIESVRGADCCGSCCMYWLRSK